MTLAVFLFRQEIIENPAFSDFIMYLIISIASFFALSGRTDL